MLIFDTGLIMLKIIIFLSNDFRTKNRTIFSSCFFNDSEENIQAMERLIKEYNIGGLTFQVGCSSYQL
jgi:hypothetical protein